MANRTSEDACLPQHGRQHVGYRGDQAAEPRAASRERVPAAQARGPPEVPARAVGLSQSPALTGKAPPHGVPPVRLSPVQDPLGCQKSVCAAVTRYRGPTSTADPARRPSTNTAAVARVTAA